MTRARAAFRQADVRRAVKGASDSGLTVARAEIDMTGKIVIVFEAGAEHEPAAADARTGIIKRRLGAGN
ncbi:MAG: hypothetical protein ACREC4_00890 [Methylocella sp.]